MRSRGIGLRLAAESGPRAARRLLSVCLAIVLGGAAGAPHRHKNDLSDLATDGRSDSGVFVDVSPAERGAPIAESLRWIDDDPCFACLPSDFVATVAEEPAPIAPLSAAGRARLFVPRNDRIPGLRRLASRSPPRV